MYWLLSCFSGKFRIPDRDELKIAGFRILPDSLSNQKLFHVSLFWVLGLCSATLLLPIVRAVDLPCFQVVIICLAVALVSWCFHCQRQFVLVETVGRQLKCALHLYLVLLLGTLILNGLAIRLGF